MRSTPLTMSGLVCAFLLGVLVGAGPWAMAQRERAESVQTVSSLVAAADEAEIREILRILRELDRLIMDARNQVDDDEEAALATIEAAILLKQSLLFQGSLARPQILGVFVSSWITFFDEVDSRLQSATDLLILGKALLIGDFHDSAKTELERAEEWKVWFFEQFQRANPIDSEPDAARRESEGDDLFGDVLPIPPSALTALTPTATPTLAPPATPTPTPSLGTSIEIIGEPIRGGTVRIVTTGLTPNGAFSKTVCRSGSCETAQLRADATGRFEGSLGPLQAGTYSISVVDAQSGRSVQRSFQVS